MLQVAEEFQFQKERKTTHAMKLIKNSRKACIAGTFFIDGMTILSVPRYIRVASYY